MTCTRALRACKNLTHCRSQDTQMQTDLNPLMHSDRFKGEHLKYHFNTHSLLHPPFVQVFYLKLKNKYKS